MLDILKILINFFYGDKLPQDETLLKMKSLLQLYASDSSELISRYLFERHKEQVTIFKPNFKKFFLKKSFPQKSILSGEYTLGSLTVRCQMLREHLRVEVLNARHLKPPDPHSTRVADKNFLASSRRRRNLASNSNLYRSSLNLDWMKDKIKVFKSNLQVQEQNTNLSARN